MVKVWKIVKPPKRKTIKQELNFLKKKGIILSPWIENIYLNKKNRRARSPGLPLLFKFGGYCNRLSKPSDSLNV